MDGTGGERCRAASALIHLAESYLAEIEDLIREALVHDALDKLQDFVRDFAPPQLRQDVILLRGHFRRLTTEVRRGLARREELDAVPARVLDLAGEAHRAALDKAAAAAEKRPSSGGIVERLDDVRRHYWLERHRDRPPTETVAFKAEDISKTYRKGPFCLEQISFELRAAEITGVVGRNASGKTTLLRIVMGDLRPDSGKTSYPMLTRDRRGWARIKRQIADVPQSLPRWHGRLRPNLNYVAAMHGVRGKGNRDLINWYVERYGLADYQDSTWGEISGGYQTRFELVRALVSSPKLLVLDEPLAFLDVTARQAFLGNLHAIATSLEAPVAIIITSQHLYEIEAVADQMILLDDGKCLYAGARDKIGERVPDRMVEVTIRAPRPEMIALLEPLGLRSIEATIEGYIMAFPKQTRANAVYETLYRAYAGRLVDFRDITDSARSLLQAQIAARHLSEG